MDRAAVCRKRIISIRFAPPISAVNLPKDLSSGTSSKTLSADAVETAFIADNPGMKKQGLAISCDGPRLEEVRICMNKDLGFRSCPEVDRKGCRSNTTEIIPIR